jgi:hypothetical protein
MRRQMSGTLGVVAVAAAAAALATPASAEAPGSETISGVIVAKTTAGVRTVLATAVIAKGVLNGSGKLVEVPSQPADPDNVLRDDVVFRGGALHLVSTNVSFDLSIDPRSCVASLLVGSTAVIDGGTGRFANASGSFVGTLRGHALAVRDPDGSCSQEQPPLIEVDKFVEEGTLSF